MPIFPKPPRQNGEYDAGRKQLGEGAVVVEANSDAYLAGFFAGLAAANPDANAVLAPDRNHLSKKTSWPSQDSLTSPSSASTSWSYPLSRITSASSSSQAPGVSREHAFHKSPATQLNVLPSITNSGVDENLLDFIPLALTACPPPPDSYGWSHSSHGTANFPTSQPCMTVGEDVPLHWSPMRGPDASQHNGHAMNEAQPYASRPNERHNSPFVGSATFQPEPTTATSTHDAGEYIQTQDPFDESVTITSESNPKKRQTSTAPLPYASRRSPKSTRKSSSPGTREVEHDATKGIFRAYGSKRSKFNEKSRLGTALTREVGACATCRKKKQRCDQSSKERFMPCGRCAGTLPHLLPGPCCRVEIIDIRLFRLGSTATPAILQQWMLSKKSGTGTLFEPPRRVYITHDVNVTSFAVTISRFLPDPVDTTAYMWTDPAGVKRAYVLPPYYISDMAEAAENMRRYARTARPEFTKALLSNGNPIVRKTFEEAERYYTASKSELVAAALMFWSATRMIERFWLICGTNILGIPPMEHNIGPCRRNPFLDAIPVTPVMDTQLDELAIKDVLIPLKVSLLRLLKTRVLAKKKEYWYEIYLASFIILHNTERVLDHVVDFSRRFGITSQPKSNDETSLSHAYYHACKTVLAYFHFASGGVAPMSLDWLDPTEHTLPMDEQQIAYLRDMKAEVKRQDVQLQDLKGKSMYGTEMYWCHQMLFPDWKADMPHIGRFIEITEKDFLIA